jgi:hypothetical protein
VNFHNEIVKTDKTGISKYRGDGKKSHKWLCENPEDYAPLGYASQSKILVPNRGYHMAIRFKMALKGSIHQVLSINNDEGNK